MEGYQNFAFLYYFLFYLIFPTFIFEVAFMHIVISEPYYFSLLHAMLLKNSNR